MKLPQVWEFDGATLPITHTTFPAGEPCVTVTPPTSPTSDISVFYNPTSSEEWMVLMHTLHVVAEFGHGHQKFVYIPYLPGGRSDRVMMPGQNAGALLYQSQLVSHKRANWRLFTLDYHNPTKLHAGITNIPRCDVLGKLGKRLGLVGYDTTRDVLGWAMKSTYVEVDGVGRGIFKDPITGDGKKKSAVGRLAVLGGERGLRVVSNATPEEERASELSPVFEDGKFLREQTWESVRSICEGGL